MAKEFKAEGIKQKIALFNAVAEKLPLFIDQIEAEFDEEDDVGEGGYAPMLCPSCCRYLDHISFWMHIRDETIVHKVKCGHCESIISMLIQVEPTPYKTDRGSPLGDVAENPNHPDV